MPRLIPQKSSFYTEFQSQYEKEKEDFCVYVTSYTSFLERLENIIKTKKENIISTAMLEDFLGLVTTSSFSSLPASALNILISQNNIKTSNFNNAIQAAKKQLEDHIISCECETAFKIKEKQNIAEAKKKRLAALIGRISIRISSTEQQAKSSRLPAEQINSDIKTIFGREELRFENESNGYFIYRREEKAEHLSRGEENAIALIYFFNTLLDFKIDKDKTIVILDDPISSFDSNFYYNTLSYMRNCCSKFGQNF